MKTTIIRLLSIIVTAFVMALFSHVAADAASVTLPATGQTRCYDSAGNTINCIGTKQDGALRMGASWPAERFTDNGNGTFTDSLTGLVWLSDNTCLLRTPVAGISWFAQALDAANKLADGQCGLSDGSVIGAWRIPNINEANSLFDVTKNGPPNSSLPSGVFFKQTYNISIPTSTTYKKNIDNYIGVYFDGTNAVISKVNSSFQVWGGNYSIEAVRNP